MHKLFVDIMIKSSIPFKSTILIVVFGLMLCNISFGQQRYNSDPYKIHFDNLDIEQTRTEVVTYKIKRVVSKKYEIQTDGSKKEIPQSEFSIVEFNQAGNPIQYIHKSFRSSKDSNEEISKTQRYSFEYDTLNNLIHIQEYESDYFSNGNAAEIDVYFFYNKSNTLIEQRYSRKYIRNPNYQYQYPAIPDDSSHVKHTFNYDESKKVTTVYRNEYSCYYKQRWLDTLTFNCSFDSVFIEKYLPKGVKKDKEGRIIESTQYARHVLLKSGACISPESKADLITKYYYGKNGKLIKSVSHTRKGKYFRKRRWKYNEKGLLQSIQFDKSNLITLYEYEFY